MPPLKFRKSDLTEQVAFRCMGIRGQEIWTGQGPTDGPKKPGKTRTRLRGIFADADAIVRRKFR